MSFSPLISGTVPHHNKFNNRTGRVDKVIQHHWASTRGGVETLTSPKLKKSATYIVLNTGEILGQVPEEFRPWTSGSQAADGRAITIEVQNETGSPDWRVSEAAITSIVKLLADIATRYGWTHLSDSNYMGHYQFSNTACPGPYIRQRMAKIRARATELIGGNVPAPAPAPEQTNWNGPFSADYIRDVQSKLNRVGYSLAVDGSRGPATQAAIKDFQAKNGLTVDASPGPETMAKLNAAVSSKTQTPTPAPQPAQRLDVRGLQAAVGAAQDNSWGPDTDKRLEAVRQSSGRHGEKFPFGVKFAQEVVRTKVDGDWGRNSVKAHDEAVKRIQAALRDMGLYRSSIDGNWGPATEDAYLQARSNAKR